MLCSYTAPGLFFGLVQSPRIRSRLFFSNIEKIKRQKICAVTGGGNSALMSCFVGFLDTSTFSRFVYERIESVVDPHGAEKEICQAGVLGKQGCGARSPAPGTAQFFVALFLYRFVFVYVVLRLHRGW